MDGWNYAVRYTQNKSVIHGRWSLKNVSGSINNGTYHTPSKIWECLFYSIVHRKCLKTHFYWCRTVGHLCKGCLSILLDCSCRWFRAWQRYTGQTEGAYPLAANPVESQSVILSSTVEDRPRPGGIDNTDIIVNGGDNKDDDPQLLRTLEEGRDYVLVQQEVWEKFREWYIFYFNWDFFVCHVCIQIIISMSQRKDFIFQRVGCANFLL